MFVVWVVLYRVEYAGDELIGIRTTKESAEKLAESKIMECYHSQNFVIQQCEVLT